MDAACTRNVPRAPRYVKRWVNVCRDLATCVSRTFRCLIADARHGHSAAALPFHNHTM
jgi:hypothetical protein